MLRFELACLIAVTIWLASRVRGWIALRKFTTSRGCKSAINERAWDYLGVCKAFAATRAVFSGSLLSYMDGLWAIHGDTYSSTIMGNQITFTRDASNIKQILTSQWSDYDAAKGLRTRMFRHLAPGAIAAADGRGWKDLRNMRRSQFVALDNFFFIESQERHFQRLAKRIPTGEAVEVQSLLVDLMTDLMGDVMLGDPLDCLCPDQSIEKKRFAEALEVVSDHMAKTGFLGPAAILLKSTEQLKATSALHNYIEKVIRQRLQDLDHARETCLLDKKRCVQDSLIARTTNVLELRTHLLSLIVGANHSVGSLLSSTVWALSRNPKLRSSILVKVGHDAPSKEQLKSFTYLTHVLYEVLRLYPPLPFNARRANKNTWLHRGGGPAGADPIVVKKGQCVVFSIWGSQRSCLNFGDDAHLFRPERWAFLKAETPGFLPFLLGPRQCLGQQFALLEATYLLVRLLQHFTEIESNDDGGFKPGLRLALMHADGVHVTFR